MNPLRSPSGFRRGSVVTAALLLSLARTASADGDVMAYVDSAGDLWLLGDELGNNVRVGAGGEDQDTFRVTGHAGTTVNGQPSVTFFAPGTRILVLLGSGNNVVGAGTDYGSNPSCCDRDLIVLGSAGRDTLNGLGPFDSVFADLGGGNDVLNWGEGASDLRNALVRTGAGDDVLDLVGLIDSRVETGAGDDRLVVGWAVSSAILDLGPDDDTVTLAEGGTFELQGGTGNDVIIVDELTGGAFRIDGGYGRDRVHISARADDFPLPRVDPITIDLGPDDDRLELARARFGTVLFDGGPGRDVLLDFGDTEYDGSPDIRSFEHGGSGRGVPRASPEEDLAIQTRLTGRVVLPDGSPLVGARVGIPVHDRVTTTDFRGSFVFDPLLTRHESLELTVAATVNGRRRSGAARATILPGSVDTGDVLLGPRLSGVLLYGTSTDGFARVRRNAIESHLRGIGLWPEGIIALSLMPTDLSPYGAIWYLGRNVPAGDRPRLVDFVRAGGGLHLTGPSGVNVVSLESLVNELLASAAIDVRFRSAGGFHAFNPSAVGGVTRLPNVLTTFDRVGYGRFLEGVPERNVLAALLSGDVFAAAWDSADLVGTRGRLSLILDDAWIQPGESRDVVENLHAFLTREPNVQPAR